LETV
jgi:hypothetical protein